eukprot:6251250-Amphidinium_carterae.2
MFVGCLTAARDEHKKWLDMLPEQQAVLERAFIMGTVNKAPDTVSAHMRVDLLDAVPKFTKEKMTRTGTYQIQASSSTSSRGR